MEWIPAKTILSPWHEEEGWFGSRYSLNLYKGCCHGCIYCDSRSECYGIEDFDRVRGKKDELEILARELKSKRRRGVVMTGSMSDSYNPFEERYRITRGALQLMDGEGFGAAIMTKSTLVLRDADVLLAISRHSPAAVGFTVTTADDALCRRIERFTPPSGQRFAAMERLAGQGIACGILMMPLLPFINDTEDNIRALVKQTAESGGKWVFAYPGLGVTLRQNQRAYFYDRLEEGFPGLKERYILTFGDQYACASPRHQELWQCLTECCRESGLMWDMKEINAYLQQPYRTEQMTLL